MAITQAELVAVLHELTPVLTGGWIQKIGEPEPGMLIFEIRIPGSTLRLLVSLNTEHARLHLVSQPHPNPSVPPPFCQFLRARLLGARLDRLAQLNEDRIARLDLTTAAGPCSIIVEFFGKQADLLVLDADGSIIATYRRASARVGQPYHPPPPRTAEHRPDTPPVMEVEGQPPFPISASLERRYARLKEDTTRQRLTGAREALLRKTIKKQRRLADALKHDLAKAAQYERHARYGELLKGALGRLRKGQDAVTVVDYFDERLPELTIPLDPSKSPQGNMEDYFGKHRKYLTAQEHIAPRIDSIEGEIARMEQELQEIRLGRWQPQDPTPSRTSSRTPRRIDTSAQRRGPFRRFTSSDGLAIYVGRNARENEDLTFGFAKSDDLWLHAHGTPGSHVVVRLERGAEPPVETLRDAATLALLYSDLKKAGKGDVIYTRRKWIRKAKGAGPGSVTVTQERSLFIRLDKARLDALKQRSA